MGELHEGNIHIYRVDLVPFAHHRVAERHLQ